MPVTTPNILHIGLENPAELLNSGAYGAGAVIHVQSSTAEGGTFADLAGTGSTPLIAIVSGTNEYTAYDPSGAVAQWYRWRLEDTTGAAKVGAWSAAFQAGDTTGGLICSIQDVEGELGQTLSANDTESVIDKIRQITTAIEGVTGRWFLPRPLSGTTTYRVGTTNLQRIRLSKGIRAITTLGIARSNQPDTGGTYSTASATDYWLDPPEMDRDPGWPATSIVLNSTSSLRLVPATFGAEITGAFGFAAVPYDIQGVAIRAVIRRYIGKSGGGVSVAVGPHGTEFLLPDMSGADRETLIRYATRAF